MLVPSPKSSAFPEVDFASRVLDFPPSIVKDDLEHRALSQIMALLCNADTSEITQMLCSNRLFLRRLAEEKRPFDRAVTLDIVPDGERLKSKLL